MAAANVLPTEELLRRMARVNDNEYIKETFHAYIVERVEKLPVRVLQGVGIALLLVEEHGKFTTYTGSPEAGNTLWENLEAYIPCFTDDPDVQKEALQAMGRIIKALR